MEIHSLYLLTYFLAVAFLVALLARLGLDFYHWSRKAGLYRLLAGQRISLKPLRQNLPWTIFLLSLAGAIFGWVMISWVGSWFVREWLLLILPVLAILCNELSLSKKDFSLFAVYALFAGLLEQRKTGLDFFERLTKVVDGLPPGEVQKACRESQQRRRSGLPVDQSCQALSELHPILRELFFTLRLTGWQASPAFDLALERMVQRLGRQWDRVSRWMVFREQIQPFLQFYQMAILATLLYLVVNGLPAFKLAWPSYSVIAWIGLGCLLVAGILYLAHNRVWLRRLLCSMLLIASLAPLWQYASLPRLYVLQLDSVTHVSERVSYKIAGWEQIQVPGADPKAPSVPPEKQEESATSFALPTSTPALQNVVDVRSQPALSKNQENDYSWVIPCCQPK